MNTTSGIYYAMGTLLRIRVNGTTDKGALENVRLRMIQTVQRLENHLSLYRPASEISHINAEAGRAPVVVSAETFQVVQAALRFARLSGGACDPTIYPLLRLWGIYRRDGLVPNTEARDLALERVGHNRVELDPDKQTVFLKDKGMGLDLGWIAKGFAMDKALEVARTEPEIIEIMMDFGGQLLFWNRFTPVPQFILIDLPGVSEDLPRFTLSENASVSTTSNAERAATLYDPLTGKISRIGHILDPRSGTPVDQELCVTVAARTATESDALSTALFVLGVEEGMGCLEKVSDAQAVFFWKDVNAEIHFKTAGESKIFSRGAATSYNSTHRRTS